MTESCHRNNYFQITSKLARFVLFQCMHCLQGCSRFFSGKLTKFGVECLVTICPINVQVIYTDSSHQYTVQCFCCLQWQEQFAWWSNAMRCHVIKDHFDQEIKCFIWLITESHASLLVGTEQTSQLRFSYFSMKSWTTKAAKNMFCL